MGILDDLLDGEGPPWGDIAAAFVGGIEGARTGAAKQIMNVVLQWGSHLSKNALSQWSAVVKAGHRCEFAGCDVGAVSLCVCCKQPFCLGHVLVNYHAEAICEGCAQSATRARAERGSEQARRKAALEALELGEDASWEEIRTQYRRLVVKHNADRPQTAQRRRKNEARLKEINAAYDILRKHQEAA